MPERERFPDEDVAVAEVGVVVQVTAAETGGGDADLEFVFGWLGEVSGFLGSVSASWSAVGCLESLLYRSTHYSQVFHSVEHRGLDVGGHCVCMSIGFHRWEIDTVRDERDMLIDI